MWSILLFPLKACPFVLCKPTSETPLSILLQFVTNTTFAYFTSSECGQRSTAVILNPSNPDYSPEITFQGISYVDVDYSARFYLGIIPTSDGHCTVSCDSYDNARVADVDGSVTGVANSTIIGENAPLAFPSPICNGIAEWGAIQCTGITMRSVTFSVISTDPNARNLGPIQVMRLDPTDPQATGGTVGSSGSATLSGRTYWSRGGYFDPCPDMEPSLIFRCAQSCRV